MNTDSIRQRCLSFPEATEKLQWSDALCFKVAGKMFAVLGLDNPRLSFKCSPDLFAELVELEDILPSPYLGRYNWVMLERLDALGNKELAALLRKSYEMVVEKEGSRNKGTRSKRKSRPREDVTRKDRTDPLI